MNHKYGTFSLDLPNHHPPRSHPPAPTSNSRCFRAFPCRDCAWRFREWRSSFPGRTAASLRSLMEFSETRRRDQRRRSRVIYPAVGKNRITGHAGRAMNYSDTTLTSVDYHRSRLDLYFTAERRRERERPSCVLQVNRIPCSCGIHRAQRAQRTRRPARPITGMLKLNSNMRRRRDSGNYVRLFSTSVLQRSSLLIPAARHFNSPSRKLTAQSSDN